MPRKTRSITTIELYLPNEAKRAQRSNSCNVLGTSEICQDSVSSAWLKGWMTPALLSVDHRTRGSEDSHAEV